MDNETSTPRAGHISDVGLLDLRYAKTAEDLAQIKSISDVGAVLVPESLMGALSGIAMSDVGGVVGIPEGVKVNCQTGQIYMSGDALAAGDSETVLLVCGQLFVTGTVESVGYKEIRIFGQMFAPRSGQAAISAKMGQLSGQTIYTANDPRVVMGSDEIGAEYLELLPEVSSLAVIGHLTILGDVTKELFKEKISEIALIGKITAPKSLIPLVQVLTKLRLGQISSDEE